MLRSIRSKVLMAIIGVTLLTASAITLVFYMKSSVLIEENYTFNTSERTGQLVRTMDQELADVYFINTSAACDPALEALVNRYREQKSDSVLEEIASLLHEYSSRNHTLESIYLVMGEERLAVTSQDYPLYRKNIPEETVAQVGMLAEEYVTPVVQEDFVHSSGRVITLPQIMTAGSFEDVYLLANINERTLYYDYLDGLQGEKASQVLLLNRQGEIISAPDSSLVGTVYEAGEGQELPLTDGVYKQGRSGEIRIFNRGDFSECAILLSVTRGEILKELNQMQVFLLLILAIFLALSLIPAKLIAGTVYRPLKKLTSAMEEVSQGELEVRAEVVSKDEIGKLSNTFNHMLDQIEELIQRLLEEENQKKDAELEALQYQITPHFMYNTLNSIKFAALVKGEKELGGLIGDFVELLQTTISKKGAMITVADELHILGCYLNLQSFRYGGTIKVEYEVEKEAENCLLPRLLLQPLVENAILHGIDLKKEEGRILIRAGIKDGLLRIDVTDNGRGMTEEQIHTLLNSKVKKTSGLSAIGIPNIRDRLHLYYGEKGTITYQSGHTGTTATVSLPAARAADRPPHNSAGPLWNMAEPLNDSAEKQHNEADPLHNGVGELHNEDEAQNNSAGVMSNEVEPLRNKAEPLRKVDKADKSERGV
ncbi:histidine kinase [Blautia schinkii]|nr:histidine kinase [Blautia schinkii]